MNEYRYSTFSDPRIFGTNISYGFIRNYRSSFNDLAKIYHYRADKEKVKEILKFKDTVIPKENIPIPWDDLTEMYEDSELKKLYEFAGLNFEEFDELDEISEDYIETNWKPAALDTPYYFYRIGEFYYDKKDFSKSKGQIINTYEGIICSILNKPKKIEINFLNSDVTICSNCGNCGKHFRKKYHYKSHIENCNLSDIKKIMREINNK